jgi:hypothetical protein
MAKPIKFRRLTARLIWRELDYVRRIAERTHIRPLIRLRRYLRPTLLAFEMLLSSRRRGIHGVGRCAVRVGWLIIRIDDPARRTKPIQRLDRRGTGSARLPRRRNRLGVDNLYVFQPNVVSQRKS